MLVSQRRGLKYPSIKIMIFEGIRSLGLEMHKKRCQKRHGDQLGSLSHRPGSEVMLPWTLRKPPERSMVAVVTQSPGNQIPCRGWR